MVVLDKIPVFFDLIFLSHFLLAKKQKNADFA
jgi:hypothetical protein